MELLEFSPEEGVFRWRKGARAGKIAGRNTLGYREIGIDNGIYHVHRLAWLWAYGRFPMRIDHIDRDRANNRLDNLREATVGENRHNAPATNATGLKGISFRSDCRYRPWLAVITKAKKNHYIGFFETKELAVAAYREAAHLLYGEFATYE